MIINDISELIGRTPLIRINRIADKSTHAEILAKVEGMNPGGSLKDRACWHMIEQAVKNGDLKEGATVIEPTSGNTGIGIAMICALKRFRCILTMPEALSLERTFLLRHFGAEVVLTPTKLGMEGAIAKAEQLARTIPGSYIPRQFDNVHNPEAHRISTVKEILTDCDQSLDAFVAGVGTGGTISGTGEALKKQDPHILVVAVEPARSAVLSGKKGGQHNIQGIGAGFVPKNLNRDVIDEIVTVTDREAFQMMRRLGREEGISAGVSSGANLVAATRVAKRLGPGKRVVTLLCDTADRYFSLEQYFEA